ncbi:hypothetical protein DFS34DRAFT_277367 [Phlyctochytrium arcticum]|nr:hypothetical protein DFS34DRAFT_277367 [Phlyctochytrium arcticum]
MPVYDLLLYKLCHQAPNPYVQTLAQKVYDSTAAPTTDTSNDPPTETPLNPVHSSSRQFFMRWSNKIFTDTEKSAVEVCYTLLGRVGVRFNTFVGKCVPRHDLQQDENFDDLILRSNFTKQEITEEQLVGSTLPTSASTWKQVKEHRFSLLYHIAYTQSPDTSAGLTASLETNKLLVSLLALSGFSFILFLVQWTITETAIMALKTSVATLIGGVVSALFVSTMNGFTQRNLLP